jgi:hypothetical protein
MLYMLSNGTDTSTLLVTLIASILITAVIFIKEKKNDPERA